MAYQFLKVAILIIGLAIYAFLWNTMTHFDGYDGNCIDEPFLIWLSFPRRSHIKLMFKTFLPLLPFFSSQQVTYFMLIAILYREGNYILIGILTKLKNHQSSLPFWKKGPWPADKNTSETFRDFLVDFSKYKFWQYMVTFQSNFLLILLLVSLLWLTTFFVKSYTVQIHQHLMPEFTTKSGFFCCSLDTTEAGTPYLLLC